MRYFRIISGEDDKGIICTDSEQKDDLIIEECIQNYARELYDEGSSCYATDIVVELNKKFPIYNAKALLFNVINIEQ
jgi:hypothetical protein